jgi:hypothetical protein
MSHHSLNGKEGLVQIGNSLDQIANSAVRTYGTYAQGYAEGYQAYQQNTGGTQRTGLINTPNGSALYHVDSNGNGIVYPQQLQSVEQERRARKQ